MTSLTSKKCPPLQGIAHVPGDKSISHRAIMFGALAIGETVITGLLEGEDVLHTAQALRAMGAEIVRHDDGTWHVHGVGVGGLREPHAPLEMGNSGTSTRLLMGLVAGHPISATFTGDASLSKRPMKRVMTPLEMMGATFEGMQGDKLPLTVKGAEDPLSITYRLPVASAQVKSAILLAGLNARGTTTVIEDTPTRDHTENMLRHFGAQVVVETLENGAEALHMEGQQDLKAAPIFVPADPSSAAFPVVAALINEGSAIRIENVGISPRRIGLYETLKDMGAEIVFENIRTQAGEKTADIVVKGTGSLRGVVVDPARVASMIDEFPVLAVAAACAQGTTHMSDLGELRVKESDRLLMMAQGLKACGVDCEMGEDTLVIHGTGKPPKGGVFIETALDHRIAMSFLVLGSVTAEPVTVDDATPIQTSFPDFVELMNGLGCRIGV